MQLENANRATPPLATVCICAPSDGNDPVAVTFGN